MRIPWEYQCTPKHIHSNNAHECTRANFQHAFCFKTRPPNLSLRTSKTTTRPLNPSRSGSSWVLAPRHQCKPVALVRSQAGPHHGPHHHRRQPTSQSLQIMPTHHRVSRANDAMPTGESAQQDHTDGNASILGSPQSHCTTTPAKGCLAPSDMARHDVGLIPHSPCQWWPTITLESRTGTSGHCAAALVKTCSGNCE